MTVGKHYNLAGYATLSGKSAEELRDKKPDLKWMCVTLEAVKSQIE